jgi:hypothetical protein
MCTSACQYSSHAKNGLLTLLTSQCLLIDYQTVGTPLVVCGMHFVDLLAWEA